MDNFLIPLKQEFGEHRVRAHELLAQHSALKIGGPAALYLEVDKTNDLVKAIELSHKAGVPFLVIGTGSKTIFSDEGYPGLIIKNNTRQFDVLSRKGKIRNNKIDVDRAYVFADSGAIHNQVVRFTIDQGYSGLEETLGLQGTIGGMLFEEQDIIESILPTMYQIQAVTYDGKVLDVLPHDLVYSDKKGDMKKGKFVVLSVVYELFPSHSALLWDKGTKKIEARKKIMPDSPFSFRAFSDITIAEAMSIPTPGYIRSVEYLLTKAGVNGKKVGDAVLSDEHPSYIINRGNATGNDIITLLEEVIAHIRREFGVKLRPSATIIKG
jgi:UDP-N-acetylmuramate dehydrogenase